MDQVEEIKKKANIADIVGGYVDLKRAGRNLKGLCPFHEERTASFMVNEELSIYKCFGCGAGGDVIKFLMDIEGLDFREALQKLADRVGVKLTEVASSKDRSLKTKLYEINSLTAEYYHYLLTEHGSGMEARQYLKSRGVNEKLIKTFKLGYSINAWDGLSTYLYRKKGYDMETLLKSGLIIESKQGGYDRFRGRIIFPFTDAAGRVVGFSGRVLPEFAEEGAGAKYINSPETPVYHKSEVLFGLEQARQAIRKNNRVVAVEGPMDMISSYAAGVTETVAVNGTALTPEMLVILSRLCDRIVLSLDADMAGEAAIKRSIDEAEKVNLSIKVIDIVGGKDPDEVARKSPKEWRRQVDGAVEVYEFVINRAIKKWGVEGSEAIRRVSDEVIPYLNKIRNKVIQAYWVGKLAKTFGVEEQRVWEEMGKTFRQEKVGTVSEIKQEAKSLSRIEMLGRQLIGLLLSSNKDQVWLVKDMLKGMSFEGAWGKLLVRILENGPIGSVDEFVKQLPAELVPVAQEAYLMEVEDMVEDRELEKTTVELLNENIKQKQLKLSEEIARFEEMGDEIKAGELTKQLTELSYKRR